MRTQVHAIIVPSEIGEFGDEVRRIFMELGRAYSDESLAGECAPPIDVYETDETVEITMDLPGVEPSAVRVVIKGDAVLVAGEKAPRRGRGEASFHLVERGFGRFARTVRLSRACDTGRARATLDRGELRLTLPKAGERRGRPHHVPVTTLPQ